MRALQVDLGMQEDLLHAVQQLQTDVRFQIVLKWELSEEILAKAGVKQGCLASLEIFSLFMDRLERFLEKEVAEDIELQQKVRFLRCLMPLLLFTDDIVLIARDTAGAHGLLDLLYDFCNQNSLTVNIEKTQWMAQPGPNCTWGSLRYGDQILERVSNFRYLGMQIDGWASMSLMA